MRIIEFHKHTMLSRSAIDNWIRNGKIPAKKILLSKPVGKITYFWDIDDGFAKNFIQKMSKLKKVCLCCGKPIKRNLVQKFCSEKCCVKISNLSRSEYRKKYRATDKYRKKRRDKQRERYKNDSHYRLTLLAKELEVRVKEKDKIKERRRKYHNKNREKLNQKSLEYYNKNRDKIREYYKKNREEINRKQREYRHRKKQEMAKAGI